MIKTTGSGSTISEAVTNAIPSLQASKSTSFDIKILDKEGKVTSPHFKTYVTQGEWYEVEHGVVEPRVNLFFELYMKNPAHKLGPGETTSFLIDTGAAVTTIRESELTFDLDRSLRYTNTFPFEQAFSPPVNRHLYLVRFETEDGMMMGQTAVALGNACIQE